METEPRKDRQYFTPPRKLSMELGSNEGNVRFRDWNYNAYHVVSIKSKYFLLLPRLLVKNGRVLQLFSGGNDKQGFPSKQCVLTHAKIHLLLRKGKSRYRPRRAGGRKCKSVQGCTVDAILSGFNLVIEDTKSREGHPWTERRCCDLVVGAQKG